MGKKKLLSIFYKAMYKIILKFPFNNTIEKTSLIQYNKVSGRYLYEGKNTNH